MRDGPTPCPSLSKGTCWSTLSRFRLLGVRLRFAGGGFLGSSSGSCGLRSLRRPGSLFLFRVPGCAIVISDIASHPELHPAHTIAPGFGDRAINGPGVV